MYVLKLETAKEVHDLQVAASGPLLATPLRLAVGAQITVTVTVNLIWI